jgi:spore coat protein CotH
LRSRASIISILVRLTVLALLAAFAPLRAAAASVGSEPGADLFTNGAMVRLAIELMPTNLQSLRQEPRRKVPAIVREGGRVYTNVAVHLKGALGSFRGVDDKPGLALNFQSLAAGQSFHGLHKIMLNNSVQDPSYLNEKLAGDLFRAAGVPAPRTSHALVELNGRPLGLYVLKEGFSKDFLGLYFQQADGNLYDINQGFYDLGSGADLPQRFRLDSGSGPAAMPDLAALIAACQEKDPAQRWTKLNATLDLSRFLSFMAMEIITCHCDGYSVYGHNFRLYHDPGSDKLVFIPNDLDRMFEECRAQTLNPGFSAKVAAAVFQTPEGRQQYVERCAWLCTNVFNQEKLTNQVEHLAACLRPAFAAGQPHATRSFDEAVNAVRARLRRRTEAISQELSLPPENPSRGSGRVTR